MVDKENQKQQNDPMVEDKITNDDIDNEALAQEVPDTESETSEDIAEEEDKPEDTVEENSTETALSEAKDKYLRLYAEFENFRRRTAKERSDLIKTASEDIVSALLPVIDDLERSLNIFKENEAVSPMYEGIQLVYQKMSKILEQKGLKRMEIAQGSDFDSEYHEAVVQTPAASEELKGKIVDVIEQGYFLGDKVLRYAKVVIGS